MPARYDILGLGSTAVDDILYVDGWPAADAKLRVQRRERHGGGLTATALVAAARLGARCAYAGVLGKDEHSRFVIENCQRERIDLRHLRRREGCGPIRSVIIVDEQRHTRNIFYDTTGVVGADARWPARAVIAACRVLFVDRFGMDGMIRAARIARAAGIPVVADFETTDEPRLPELLPLVDHLVVSESFAQRLTGARHSGHAAAKLVARGHAHVVVTCGERGCWFQEAGGQAPILHPAFRVDAMDTTGCGDVFHGAYAAALARGLPMAERIRLASASAALKATRPGGQAGAPTKAAVTAFLRDHRP